jgi:hypothetical protein
MAYLGNAPTSVPLSSADILDSAITTAKIANGTIAIADLSATGTASSSTYLRGDNSWASAGGNNTPAFSATASGDQSVSSGVDTKVAYNSEVYDTDNCYNPTTYRFTPTTAGKYFLLANARCRRTTDFNDLQFSIFKNGSSISRFQINSSFHNESMLMTTVVEANGSTDYFEVYVNQSSGETDTGMNIFEFSGYRLIGV